MGWSLRTQNDTANPTLPGGVYGKYITIGRGVYWRYDGSRTRYIIFISDGGRYGMDHVDTVEYNGSIQDEDDWIFHPGTFTAQIAPVAITDIDTGTDVLTSAAHGFSNTQLVRIGSTDGQVPAATDADLKFQVSDVTTNTFKLKDEAGGSYINFADEGTGTIRIWRANAGFDDPIQGLPTFVPEVDTTFNNICYVEGMLPSGVSTAGEPPDWELFRIIGEGRKLMSYDNEGTETGIIAGDHLELSNVANQIVDNYLVNYRGVHDRIDWESWSQLRTAADVTLLQAADPDDVDAATPSFTGRYFYEQAMTTQIFVRQDLTIDFDFTGTAPAPGLGVNNYGVRWNGKIQPDFTETYTITVNSDDFVKVWINGQLILDVAIGTFTAPYNFVAAQEYDLQVEFQQFTSTAVCRVKWQSTSQALEAIPPSPEVGSTDAEVRRYENHMAFPIPVEASEVHERFMERVPGWDWTDDAGLITFLGPDRPTVYDFEVDRDDDDTIATIVKETFQVKRRPIGDRPNFLLFRYRDVLQTGYPFKFVQADREDLRRFTNGEPSNFNAEDLGVTTRSLASRMAEFQMVIKADPEHIVTVSGSRAAGKIRKNQFVNARFYERGNRRLVDGRYKVTFHSWGTRDGKNDFSLLPVPTPYYQDDALVVFTPTDLDSAWGIYEPDSYNLADGVNVTADWQDKTANNRDVPITGTPTYNTNQINGKPVVTIGVDSNDVLNIPSMSGLTQGAFFLVLKVLDTGTGGGHTLGTAADIDHYPWSVDQKIYTTFGSTSRKGPIDSILDPLQNEWHVFWGWSAPNDYKLFQNQTEIYSSTTNTVGFPSSPKIGFNGSWYAKMAIGGMYLLDEKPTDTIIANMQAYLNRVFGL